jgi:twitching motility protein PilT
LCKKKGGDGRVAALEILVGTPAVRNLIREGKVHQIPSALQVGQKSGMQTMDMALIDLVNRGLITHEEAQAKSMTPNLFRQNIVANQNGGQNTPVNRPKTKQVA